MKKRVLAILLALAMVAALLPAVALADGEMTLGDLKSALEDAKNATDLEGKIVTLTGDVTVTDTGVSPRGAAITIPEGVTLDGAGHSITADSNNWRPNSEVHIISVENTIADTTTIRNLTIVGNPNTKSGIHAYNCSGPVNITNVTINNCGNAAVQVNGSTVVATNLKTSGNAWGGVNVDKGSATASTSFKLTGKDTNIAEDSKVWTELVGKGNANVIMIDESLGWVQIKDTTTAGNPSHSYAPKSSLSGLDDDGVSKVLATNTDGTSIYYASLEEALKNGAVKTGDTITLLATNASETLSSAIPEGVTLVVGNGQTVTISASALASNSMKGSIEVQAAGTLKLNTGTFQTLIGTGGLLNLTEGSAKIDFADPKVTLTNNAAATVEDDIVLQLGSGAAVIKLDAVIENGSTVTVNSGAKLTVPTETKLTVNAGGTLNVNGIMRVASSAELDGSGTITNSGIIALMSGGANNATVNAAITLAEGGKVYSQFDASGITINNSTGGELESEVTVPGVANTSETSDPPTFSHQYDYKAPENPDPDTPSTPTTPPVWVRPGGDLMITRLPDGVNNAPVLVTITLDRALYGSYGGIEFTGGVAEVLLAPGGTAYVSDLPAGTFYTVSVPGGTVLSSDNLSGIIPVDGAAQAGFTAIPGSDDFEIVEGEGDEEGDVQEGTEETPPEETVPEEGLEELPEEGDVPAEEEPVDVPKTGDSLPSIGLALMLGLAACAVVLKKARAK